MRIFLIGYMGAGKTTLGQRLSEAMALQFADLDGHIEKSERRTIPEIFEKEGEAGFRGVERKALHSLADSTDEMVIATGGGTPCFYDNMEFMNKNGITLYLKLDIPSLVFRLQHDAAVRPLIHGMSPEQLTNFVQQHLEERKEFYEESQIEINALGMSEKKIEDLVFQIANYSR